MATLASGNAPHIWKFAEKLVDELKLTRFQWRRTRSYNVPINEEDDWLHELVIDRIKQEFDAGDVRVALNWASDIDLPVNFEILGDENVQTVGDLQYWLLAVLVAEAAYLQMYPK